MANTSAQPISVAEEQAVNSQMDPDPEEVKQCLKCSKQPQTYMCMPCRHDAFCNTCAMKMATGGKCKVCREFFSELRKINL
eukprot:gene2013-3908_t